MITNLKYCYNLTVCKVIFGIPLSNDSDTELLNFLILLGKKYINYNKSNEMPLIFILFLEYARDKIDTLVRINVNKGIENLQWQSKLRDIL